MKDKIDQQRGVAGRSEIRLDMHVGNVVVKTGPAGTVTVRGDRIARGGTDEQMERWLKACALESEEQGAALVIRDKWPPGEPPWRKEGGQMRLELELTVPEGISLDVRTGVGDVGTDGTLVLDQVRLQTGVGDITAATEGGETELRVGTGDVSWTGRAGPLHAETGTGSVTAGGRADDTHITTGTGDVALQRFACGQAHRLEATVGTGDLRVELAAPPAPRPGGSAASPVVELRTGTGDIVLLLPLGGSGAELTASTGVGSIDADKALATWEENRHTVGGSVSGAIGAGQCRLTVTAGTGDVTIRPLRAAQPAQDE